MARPNEELVTHLPARVAVGLGLRASPRRVVMILCAEIVLATASCWLFFSCSGHLRRAYPVLDPGESLSIGSDRLSVAELARRYQPLLFLAPGAASPPALFMWYEAARGNGTVELVYRTVWEDERHPNRVADALYRVYRASYFGRPLHDIEIIQLSVATADGTLKRIRYETTSRGYHASTVPHELAVATHEGGSRYRISVQSTPARADRSIQPMVRRDGSRGAQVCFGIITWNHLHALRPHEDGVYTLPVPLGLVSLTDDAYARFKLARRSQGEQVTREGSAAWTLFAVILLLAMWQLGARLAKSPRGRRDTTNHPT